MQNRNLTARNEKNSACDFFSHSGNFDAISCKKMREYREIAPENDPCMCDQYSTNTIKKQKNYIVFNLNDVLFTDDTYMRFIIADNCRSNSRN